MARWRTPHLHSLLLVLLLGSFSLSNSKLVPADHDDIRGPNDIQSESDEKKANIRMINEPQPHISLHEKADSFLDRYFNRESNSIDAGFTHAFIASFSVIVVSEIADKTFFIAAIMAMKHPRVVVFTGAITALAVMTVLSAFLGFATTVIPRVYTFYVSTALFAIFGIRMLREGYYMSKDESQEEMEEVQADLKRRDEEFERKMTDRTAPDLETGIARSVASRKIRLAMTSHVFWEALTLTFLAEWGDRSQLATIILGARENVTGVTFGGILGHSICTAMAVVGGRFIASKISPRQVTLVGGFVFLAFAISALIMGPGEDGVVATTTLLPNT